MTTLAAGGAERVISIMANYWAERSYDVFIITLSDVGADFYALHHDVSRIGLGLVGESSGIFSAIANNIKRVSKLHQALQKVDPDVVISFCEKPNILTLLASVGLKVPVIVSERTDPSIHVIGRLWSFLRRHTYPLAHTIVCQNDTVYQWAQSFFTSSQIRIIPNPVLVPLIIPDAPQSIFDFIPALNLTDRIVVAMGRLSDEKGFDLLIRAMKLVSFDREGWSLVILGDGSRKETLITSVADMGLGNKVFFAGQVKNPTSFLKQADLFVMPSRYEGFPNALCEAMACGLPVISFDCPSGPRAIIRDGIDGVLVPNGDVDLLAKAMLMLMDDPEQRRILSCHAPEVLERFSIERVMNMWEHILTNSIIPTLRG